jgi:Tat protein secretion system quality control protein TatD with DNase activity
MLIDSHCHLDFPDFAGDLDGIVARAASAGIGRMVTISTRVRRLGELIAIVERFPNVYCSVGTHPHHADEEDGISPDELVALSKHPKVVALGEAGLDYFYDNGSPEKPACRSSFTPVRRMMIVAASWKRRWRRGRSARCCTATPADASLRCGRSSSAFRFPSRAS